MIHLVFFLEERSAREMLQGLLPRILQERATFQCIFFEGKSDMKKRLPIKLRGWHGENTHFVVLQDQDGRDCKELKGEIMAICKNAGQPDILVRIACQEIESWYLADLQAVEKGLGLTNLASYQNRQIGRKPDNRLSPDRALEKLTKGSYKKVRGSRQIGLHLDPENTRSPSFRSFITGVRRIMEIQR